MMRPTPGRTLAAFALIVLAGAVRGTYAQPDVPKPAVPLVGNWRLNLARTHYGAGVDVRRSETFACDVIGPKLHCVIRSVRQDGRALVGEFAAQIGGSPAPVTGIPDMNSVTLSQPVASLLDATFFSNGKPVFAYRAFRSSNGASLMIVSMDPISRAVLTTVVAYDRQ